MIDVVAGTTSRRVITNKDGRDERCTVSASAVFVKQRALEEVQTHRIDGSRAFT